MQGSLVSHGLKMMEPWGRVTVRQCLPFKDTFLGVGEMHFYCVNH